MKEQEKLNKEGKQQEAFQKLFQRYQPVVEDTANIFKAIKPNMVVAPARILLDNLPVILSLSGMNLDEYVPNLELIVTGGDELTEPMYNTIQQAFPNAKVVPYLGHFMIGAAFGRDGLNYFPNAAGVLLDVVDGKGERVKYGEDGRAVVNFFETILWRAKDDNGRRVAPIGDIEWDGVSDISRPEG